MQAPWFRYLLSPIRQYFRDSSNVRVNDNGDGTVSFVAYNVGSGGSGGGGTNLDWDLDGGDPAGNNVFWCMDGGGP